MLGNDEPKASVPGEIVPIKEFYDYDAKYLDEGSELVIPAKLPKPKQKEVQQLAVRAFQAVDCSGLARVDFLMDPRTGKMYVNEINTMPGFTSISMYPKLWAASGIAYPEADRSAHSARDCSATQRRRRTAIHDRWGGRQIEECCFVRLKAYSTLNRTPPSRRGTPTPTKRRRTAPTEGALHLVQASDFFANHCISAASIHSKQGAMLRGM